MKLNRKAYIIDATLDFNKKLYVLFLSRNLANTFKNL